MDKSVKPETVDGRPKVTCPYCGYKMPLTYDPKNARCSGVFTRCKGRQCGQVFEIEINTK